MREDTLVEIRELLEEIRDLLRPVADAHQDAYDLRQAERERERLEDIEKLISSTPKRRKAWQLADGTLKQAEIAKKSGMDGGDTSRFFKALRELRAITEATNPTRAIEL
jgi:hypothetical protein